MIYELKRTLMNLISTYMSSVVMRSYLINRPLHVQSIFNVTAHAAFVVISIIRYPRQGINPTHHTRDLLVTMAVENATGF